MWRTITLAIHQRGVALRGGRNVRSRGVGARGRKGIDGGFERRVEETAHELHEVVIALWFAEVHVGVRERGLLSRNAKPAAFSGRDPSGAV